MALDIATSEFRVTGDELVMRFLSPTQEDRGTLHITAEGFALWKPGRYCIRRIEDPKLAEALLDLFRAAARA